MPDLSRMQSLLTFVITGGSDSGLTVLMLRASSLLNQDHRPIFISLFFSFWVFFFFRGGGGVTFFFLFRV